MSAREAGLRQSLDIQETPPDSSDEPRKRRLFSFERSPSGQTLALVAAGAAKSVEDLEISEGGHMSVLQAWTVMFCSALGAGIALVGRYPKETGYLGFPLSVLLVGTIAVIAEIAMFTTSRATEAKSFAELTRNLPQWMTTLTSICSIVWGFVLVGLYTSYVYNFINAQVLGSRFPKEGTGALGLYMCVGAAIFCAMLPTGFSGPVAQFCNNMNLATTWVVIVTAVAKGVLTIRNTPEEQRPSDLVSWNPAGFMQVTVLLSGAMFQCTVVPQLNYEVVADQRERVAVTVPLSIAGMQGLVFVLVGSVGYFALGNGMPASGNVFEYYREKHPDWMVTLLQGGIAWLMFLSTPLLGLPPKAELWNLLSAADAQGDKTPFGKAPRPWQLGLNAVLAAFGVLGPCMCGEDAYMNVVLTITAGVAANWMNMVLPGCVILYTQVTPARREGRPWATAAVQVFLIFSLAALCVSNSCVLIWNLLVPEEKEPPSQ